MNSYNKMSSSYNVLISHLKMALDVSNVTSPILYLPYSNPMDTLWQPYGCPMESLGLNPRKKWSGHNVITTSFYDNYKDSTVKNSAFRPQKDPLK